MIKSALNAGRGDLLPAAMCVFAGVAAYLAVAIGTGVLGLDRFSVMGLTPAQCIVAGVLGYFVVDALRLLCESAVWTFRGVKFACQRSGALKARIGRKALDDRAAAVEKDDVAVATRSAEADEHDATDPDARDGSLKNIADILKRFTPNPDTLVPSALVRGSSDSGASDREATARGNTARGTLDLSILHRSASDDGVVDSRSRKRTGLSRQVRAPQKAEVNRVPHKAEDNHVLQEAEVNDNPQPGDPFAKWVRTRIAEGDENVSATVLIEKSGGDPSPKTFRRDLIKAANRLGRDGFAIVPDQRLGYLHDGGKGPVRLLALPAPLVRLETVSSEYAHAALTATLLAVVMHSDGHVATEEAAVLQRFAVDTRDINDGEAARLEAWCAYLLEHPVVFSRLVRRLKAVDIAQQWELFVRAVEMAQADHRVHPAEVAVLEKLCRALEIPLTELYGALGVWGGTAAGDADDEEQSNTPNPMAGPNEDENVDRSAIAGMRPHLASAATPVRLDRDRVASIEVDTAEVAGLLSDVFLDNEEEPATDGPAFQEAEETLRGDDGHDGLDAAHRVLLARLLEQQALSREMFNEIARACNLMPDGAIETLNDWSFECFDDEIIEGDETIIVNAALIGKLEMEGVDVGNETDKAARA